jgi:uncharacterized repeat protein (TIGR04076 family)
MGNPSWAGSQWSPDLECRVYELKISVTKIMGACTSCPPLKPGDFFTLSDGDIQIPEGRHVCIWALQSLMPLITVKEREIAENRDEDWMWRVHHVQCPDPNGRVIFKIERTGKVASGGRRIQEEESRSELPVVHDSELSEGRLKELRIVVESCAARCTSRMKPGDSFRLRGGRLYIPADRHVCLYALQAALPLLPAKQRPLQDGDWMKEDCRILCPDPAGNVILRIDRLE